uniref:Uncharacterized protein n=1 Tax=Arundo donax TaxID=35708 RepID=A0A0A8ZH85_ARUDO
MPLLSASSRSLCSFFRAASYP